MDEHRPPPDHRQVLELRQSDRCGGAAVRIHQQGEEVAEGEGSLGCRMGAGGSHVLAVTMAVTVTVSRAS